MRRMSEEAITTTSTPCAMTREQFEFMLCGIESNMALAWEAAKGLNVYKCDARDIARQRRMNIMVENAIIQLEEMTNVTVATSRVETAGHIPFPPRIHHQTTMVNFDNHR